MSDNKQQTGVEWLLEQFDRNKMVMYNELGERTKVFTLTNYEIIQQAKEIEKEQNKQSYFKGWHRDIGNRDEDFEQYYNETYGGNK